MQDLGGMRIVGAFDRRGQDDLVRSVCGLFDGEARAPKVIDRRIAPMYGYAAVHVIVFPDDAPIEIQVRTEWQHEWAELFEKLADLVGRDIRYGAPPLWRWTPDEFDAFDATLQDLARAGHRTRVAMVDHAMAVATVIAAFEEAELIAPGVRGLEGFRDDIEQSLASFRDSVEEMERP